MRTLLTKPASKQKQHNQHHLTGPSHSCFITSTSSSFLPVLLTILKFSPLFPSTTTTTTTFTLYEAMKDLMARLIALPLSAGCVSESSVVVVGDQPTKRHQKDPSPPTSGGVAESTTSGRMKGSIALITLPRPSLTIGLQRLIKSIKSFSQLFLYREEEDGEEEEENSEMEMEIGFPTDVQHVAHVGLDGCSNGAHPPLHLFSLPPPTLPSSSVSLRQLEKAMASSSSSSSHGHAHINGPIGFT